MSSLSQRIGAALGIRFAGLREAGGQHGVRHLTGTLADGREVFVKAATSPGDESATAFAAEANGLRWLAGADGGPPVPQLIGVSGEFLVIELIGPQENPLPGVARRFGADLARMHAAGAPAFGAPWPGYIASLPLDNSPLDNTQACNTHAGNTHAGNTQAGSTPARSTPTVGHPPAGDARPASTDWAAWYAQRRIVPYLKKARDDGLLSRAEASLVETLVSRIGELAGPPEPPSRIHGDLWSGNVLWSAGRGWPIDPAAHGGHRETDLAMLALFGAPDLADILRGYNETVPLAEGWRARVPLHQLHPLLVHVCLFGLGYVPQLTSAARAALAGRQS